MNREIQILKKQLAREKKKNKALRRRLSLLTNESEKVKEDSPAELHSRADDARLFRHKGYLSYLFSRIKQNSFYQTWKKYTVYFRRIGLVSTTLQIAGYTFMLVQSGTAFFLVLILFLLALPIIALSAVGVYASARLCEHHDNKKIGTEIEDKNIYCFFPTRTAEFSHGTFWKQNIVTFASMPNTAVFIVSPYFFSGKGIRKNHRFYLNYTEESPGLYLIRKHYFFSLRRVFFNFRGRVTLIY